MTFLAPLFLIGLGALAAPVVIHLIQRERKQVIIFPSLMFLRRIPYQSVRRRRIRHWLLLAMRLAALLLIVLAFARPFIRRADTSVAAASGARDVVILLDQSYSMAYGDRWARARKAAHDAVNALGPDDRASLVLFATGASADVRASTDRSALSSAIDAARVTSGATRYGPALKLAQSLIAESSRPRREAILISDFQKNGWRREDGVRLPPGAVLTPVAIGDSTTSNAGVTAVNFQRAIFSGQERVTVTAAIGNHSDAAKSVDATLEIDGHAVQTIKANVEPAASGAVTFAPFTLIAAYTRGTVRITPDALPSDDAFHFVLSPSRPVPVLVVERSSAARDASLYLTRALSIGNTPTFDVAMKNADTASIADLQGRDLVILNDVPLGSAVASRLKAFVDAGGGLLVVLGERSAWPPEAADVLPGTIGDPVDRPGGRGAMLGAIDYSHPAFELFKTPRSGDFSAARFYRYRAFTPAAGAPVTVVARFDDGAPALVERTLGHGHVLVWTSTLDAFWNDLALKPVFLPFVQQIARHLVGYTDPAPWQTVGQLLDTAIDTPARGKVNHVAVSPSGQRQMLAAGGDKAGLLELADQGFYEIRSQNADEPRPRTVAVNLDPTEADLTSFDPRELVTAVAPQGPGGGGLGPEDEVSLDVQERRQAIWWYLLVAGLALLALETVISNFYSRAGRVGA
jgi:aerotolerance regulator-like protein/VWA domain-containing protein